MPSGRDIHSTKLFTAPILEGETLARMRAPLHTDEMDTDDDSSSDEADKGQGSLPGTFPGSSMTASDDSSYF